MTINLVEPGDKDEASDMALAIEVGKKLNEKYPNHPWVVSFQGRALVIRHLAIAQAIALELGKDGFACLLPKNKLGTPTETAHTAMIFGGELLEAFGLPRGPWDGREPVVPKSWGRRKSAGFQ